MLANFSAASSGIEGTAAITVEGNSIRKGANAKLIEKFSGASADSLSRTLRRKGSGLTRSDEAYATIFLSALENALKRTIFSETGLPLTVFRIGFPSASVGGLFSSVSVDTFPSDGSVEGTDFFIQVNVGTTLEDKMTLRDTRLTNALGEIYHRLDMLVGLDETSPEEFVGVFEQAYSYALS